MDESDAECSDGRQCHTGTGLNCRPDAQIHVTSARLDLLQCDGTDSTPQT